MNLLTISREDMMLRGVRRFLVGLLFGIAAGVFAAHAAEDHEVVDPRLEKGCKWPKLEGEMTVTTVYKGELICWRWR